MKSRPAITVDSVQPTQDGYRRFLSSLSSLFLNGLVKKVEGLIKLHIFQTARFFVCTAATAVKLPMRLETELDGVEGLDRLQGANSDPLADIVSRLAHVSVSDSTAEKSVMAQLLDFKYVVLDEAGAMLEPDMVVCSSVLQSWRDCAISQPNCSPDKS